MHCASRMTTTVATKAIRTMRNPCDGTATNWSEAWPWWLSLSWFWHLWTWAREEELSEAAAVASQCSCQNQGRQEEGWGGGTQPTKSIQPSRIRIEVFTAPSACVRQQMTRKFVVSVGKNLTLIPTWLLALMLLSPRHLSHVQTWWWHVLIRSFVSLQVQAPVLPHHQFKASCLQNPSPRKMPSLCWASMTPPCMPI